MLEQIEIDIIDTANKGVNLDPFISRHMHETDETGYITQMDDIPQQLNEYYTYTRKAKSPRFKIIYSITGDPIEEFDLAPELTLEEAAEVTKRFINDLPDDIIDIDLGSGL